MTPDPFGTINGNTRTRGFVDSVVVPVLAHELQHIINFSRRLYVNNSPVFEEHWLDEGLAHMAEELLFYREGEATPGSNYDIGALRTNNAIKNAYNIDQSGNATRYKNYLQNPSASSPYSPVDTLQTRGAAWTFLRYAADRMNATDHFTAGDGQVVAGAGSVTAPASGTSSEYSVVVVNTSTVGGSTTNYTLKATSSTGDGIAALVTPAAIVTAAVESPFDSPTRDFSFESRLRSSERTLMPLVPRARAWYAAQGFPARGGVVASRSEGQAVDADNGVWYKLVNSTSSGMTNLQSVFGNDIAGLVRDWSVSQALDDVASLQTQYQQRSWNYHSIFPNLGSGGQSYPLAVSMLSNGQTVSGTVVAGGAAFYRLPLGIIGSVLTLSAPAGSVNPNLLMIVVRTR
jgi:hypothetical protein